MAVWPRGAAVPTDIFPAFVRLNTVVPLLMASISPPVVVATFEVASIRKSGAVKSKPFRFAILRTT